MNNTVLTDTKEEKDLGVFVTPDWKSSTHVAKVAAKANAAVGTIKKTFTYMDCDIFKAIYPGLIRSHMEYAVQSWSPHYIRDIDKLEKVQRRATKIVPFLHDKPYEERLRILNLPTLAERRLRGDMIEVFKIMKGFENVDRTQFFKLVNEVTPYDTRGHQYRIWSPQSSSLTRRKHFDIRILTHWNKLPEKVVNSKSVNEFKNKLDFHTKRQGTSYEPMAP